MKQIAIFIAAIMFCGSSWAFTRETISVHSASMNKDVPVTVILPDGYQNMTAVATGNSGFSRSICTCRQQQTGRNS